MIFLLLGVPPRRLACRALCISYFTMRLQLSSASPASEIQPQPDNQDTERPIELIGTARRCATSNMLSSVRATQCV